MQKRRGGEKTVGIPFLTPQISFLASSGDTGVKKKNQFTTGSGTLNFPSSSMGRSRFWPGFIVELSGK